MPEWWTYTLSDFLLFSPRTYYRLFELYNAAIWPAQLATAALGAVLAGLIVRGGPGRAAAAILAACWLWVAWGFLHTRYATINWAADHIAAAFAVQAALLLALGGRLRYGAGRAAWPGLALLLFALLVQPLTGPLAGRPWTQVELFGVAPDPTALATIGALLAAERVRWELLALPLAWCAAGAATLWAMEAPDALVMPAAAGLALAARALAAGRRAPQI